MESHLFFVRQQCKVDIGYWIKPKVLAKHGVGLFLSEQLMQASVRTIYTLASLRLRAGSQAKKRHPCY